MLRNILISLGCAMLLSGCTNHASQIPQVESLARLEHSNPAKRQLTIESWHTSSGTRTIFAPTSQLPMLDIRLTFAAGSSKDGQYPGLANLTSMLLDEGASGLSAEQIASGFEDLGARFSHSSHRDMAVISLRTLSDTSIRQPAIELFTKIIAAPSFPASSLQRNKNQLLNSFQHELSDPAARAANELFLRLYQQHPYAHKPAGTKDSIANINTEMLRKFYQQYYNAGNAQLVLVGDLSSEQARQLAETITSALPQGQPAAATNAVTHPASAHWHQDMNIQQTHIHLAQLGIQRNHPDHAALYLANQVFGGSGFGSRLMEQVREQRGLTYGIYSGFSPMQARGPFTISLQTKTASAQQALDLVLQLQHEFIENGISQAELDSAKRQILGSYPLANASNAAIVSQLAMLAFYGMPLDWQDQFIEQISQLDLEQVNRAIRQHIKPEQQLLITVGPRKLDFHGAQP